MTQIQDYLENTVRGAARNVAAVYEEVIAGLEQRTAKLERRVLNIELEHNMEGEPAYSRKAYPTRNGAPLLLTNVSQEGDETRKEQQPEAVTEGQIAHETLNGNQDRPPPKPQTVTSNTIAPINQGNTERTARQAPLGNQNLGQTPPPKMITADEQERRNTTGTPNMFTQPAGSLYADSAGKTGPLPKNSCALISAMNMIAHGKWKQGMVIKADERNKGLLTVIRAVTTTENDINGALE